MDHISLCYFEAAKDLGLNPQAMDFIDGFRFMMNSEFFYFRLSHAPFNNYASATLASNKFATLSVLKGLGFSVPKSQIINRKQFVKDKGCVLDLTYPVVINPSSETSCGTGVICNIKNKAILDKILTKSFFQYGSLNVEQYIEGLTSYRLLVFYGEVIGLVERTPCFVVGDGQSSVLELVEKANEKRSELGYFHNYGKIQLNEETDFIFEEKKINLESVIANNEKLPLRYICNATVGGTYRQLPLFEMHPDNRLFASQVAQALGLNYVGLDIMCQNICDSILQTKGYVIEANFGPDITIHIPHNQSPHIAHTILQSFVTQQSSDLSKKREG